ncbi:MAG: uroporphyrinogen decarboxylase family protein [Sedimentisphaerales bacterium]
MLVNTVSQNTLRAIRFEQPDYIPIVFWINPACWHHYQPELLFALMAEHRILFGEFNQKNEELPEALPEIAPWERAGVPYTDAWGCVWETTDDGITGTVTEHPLADWSALESFTPPDPTETNGMTEIDWSSIKSVVSKSKSQGKSYAGSLEHGHTFQRLSYLRGYENLLLDMADRQPKLWRLIEMVETFNIGIVQRYLDAGAEMMCYPEDLGMQRGPLLSPEHFRNFIKPIYEHLMAPVHKAGCLVHMHSDGDIRNLADEIVLSGVDVLNLQDLVNGVDWIAENLKGKVCIDLDIDRQQITPFGSPKQIDTLIREEVEKLGSREGGLMLLYGLYPGVPLENVKAIMDAMERYSSFYT